MKIALAVALVATGCATAPDFTPASAPGVKREQLPALKQLSPSPAKTRPGRRPLSVASRDLRRKPLAHNWSGVARCESGNRWHINTGNGYFGGLQMNAAFWANYGGLDYAPRPDLATKAQQITVAERGLAVQGINAWPTCGWRLNAA